MTLYKYLTPDRINILSNKKIRFSQVKSLNDPYEMRPSYKTLAPDDIMKVIFGSGRGKAENIGFDIGYDMVQRVFDEFKNSLPEEHRHKVDEIRKSIPPREEFIEKAKSDHPSFIESVLLPAHVTMMPEIRETVYENLNQQFGMLCLSEVPDNKLMWAHYAQSFEGFVIGFDDSHEFFNSGTSEEGILNSLYPVKYSNDRPQKDHMTDLTIEDIAFCKSLDWEYEREWRMLKALDQESTLFDKHNQPILDLKGQSVHLFSFPAAAIEYVIFGCQMATSTRDELINVLNDDDYSDVQKYSCVVEDLDYRLTIRSLEN